MPRQWGTAVAPGGEPGARAEASWGREEWVRAEEQDNGRANRSWSSAEEAEGSSRTEQECGGSHWIWSLLRKLWQWSVKPQHPAVTTRVPRLWQESTSAKECRNGAVLGLISFFYWVSTKPLEFWANGFPFLGSNLPLTLFNTGSSTDAELRLWSLLNVSVFLKSWGSSITKTNPEVRKRVCRLICRCKNTNPVSLFLCV